MAEREHKGEPEGAAESVAFGRVVYALRRTVTKCDAVEGQGFLSRRGPFASSRVGSPPLYCWVRDDDLPRTNGACDSLGALLHWEQKFLKDRPLVRAHTQRSRRELVRVVAQALR